MDRISGFTGFFGQDYRIYRFFFEQDYRIYRFHWTGLQDLQGLLDFWFVIFILSFYFYRIAKI
ncbi:MAG: hypothetical protein PF484_13700, partial [Bacteroidales bacterium]|nr:hypothetical protein [Bacteroidales bacterium]